MADNMMDTVAFTGYRLKKLPFAEDEKDPNYMAFQAKLTEVIGSLIEKGYTKFISGLAVGFDTWAAEAVLLNKEKDPHVTLECAIPFSGQAEKWSPEEQARRANIIKHADSATTVCKHYSKECFFLRNAYMVDKADIVVCCYDGKKGGTAQTVAYAKRKNKTVLQIDPNYASVSIISERKHDK